MKDLTDLFKNANESVLRGFASAQLEINEKGKDPENYFISNRPDKVYEFFFYGIGYLAQRYNFLWNRGT